MNQGLDFGLADRIAVVVGCGPGIGRACAQMLASAGAQVACLDKDLPAATETADLLGNDSFPLQVDVRERDSIREAFQQVARADASITTVVNVVGYATHSPFLEMDLATWNDMIDGNVTHHYAVAQEACQYLMESGHPSLVMVSSINGLGSSPGKSAYGVAKAGVVSLVRTLALELAQYSIRVNAVAPGATATPRRKHLIAGASGDRYREWIPLGRFAEPSEIGQAVLFLASGMSSYLTGQVLAVDGGATIRAALPVSD